MVLTETGNVKDNKEKKHFDIESMMDKMAAEFPDMIKISSIGKTWEGRDIRVLELDARNKLNQ